VGYDRGVRCVPIAALLAVLSSCIGPDILQCGDVLCPPGDVCTPAGDACADPGALAICAGESDGTECSYSEIADGSCQEQV